MTDKKSPEGRRRVEWREGDKREGWDKGERREGILNNFAKLNLKSSNLVFCKDCFKNLHTA